MNTKDPLPPPLQVQQWLGLPAGLSRSLEPTLERLRGKVVLIEAFQMLCPGCVSHSLPQAQRAHETLKGEGLVVLGLHTVFEHHDVQGSAAALAAFLHEYRFSFPVGIDESHPGTRLPKTMSAYEMRGTPTQILIDRRGRMRSHRFGRVADLTLGIELGTLLSEKADNASAGLAIDQGRDTGEATQSSSEAAECGPDGCPIESAC